MTALHYTMAMIPFANMGPYRRLGIPDGAKWVDLPPRQSSDELMKGTIVAAAAPIGDFARLEPVCDFVGQYGIAAKERVGSVMFFSRVPFSEIGRTHRIKISFMSASSVRLLYLLLGYRQGFDALPFLASPNEACDGELVIGDIALKRALNASREAYVTDLVAEWYKAFELPFVFARWVIRKDAPAAIRRALENWLEPMKENDEDFVYASAKLEAERLGIPKESMVEYLLGMRRVLGSEELAGQKRFIDEFMRHGREPAFELGKGNE